GNRTLAAGYQELFAAIRVEQHQFGPWMHLERDAGLRPDGALELAAGRPEALARQAHIHDVVIVLDRLVGRDVRRFNGQGALFKFVLACERLASEQNGGTPQAGNYGSGVDESRDTHEVLLRWRSLKAGMSIAATGWVCG